MDLFTIAGTCLRRWYVTGPLLLLVAFFSYRAYAGVEPLYTSSRSIVVLPSLEQQAAAAQEEDDEPSLDDDANPYAGQGGSRFAVAVLKRNINSTAFKERLDLEEGVDQSFEAESSSDQPMIHVEATAPSEQGVHELLDSVVNEANVVLNEFQAEAGAPEITRYRTAPAVPAGPVEDATPSRLRAAGAIAVLGGGLVAAVVVALNAVLVSRRRRLEAAGGSARPGASPEPDPTDSSGDGVAPDARPHEGPTTSGTPSRVARDPGDDAHEVGDAPGGRARAHEDRVSAYAGD